jgi:hypothetical protein
MEKKVKIKCGQTLSRRSHTPFEGQTLVKKPESEEASSLAKKSAHQFPSLNM